MLIKGVLSLGAVTKFAQNERASKKGALGVQEKSLILSWTSLILDLQLHRFSEEVSSLFFFFDIKNLYFLSRSLDASCLATSTWKIQENAVVVHL